MNWGVASRPRKTGRSRLPRSCLRMHRKKLIVATLAVVVLLCVFLAVHSWNFQSQDFTVITEKFIADAQVINLGRLEIDGNAVTLSGFSAGAAMTNQLFVSHSSLFRGAAIFSQVYYRCGPKNIIQFGIQCSHYGKQWFPYKVEYAVQDARNYAKDGLIDDLRHLENNRVFIWTGGADEYIPKKPATENKKFYETFITNPDQISLTVNEGAKHLLPTDSFGAACDADATDNYYLGNCNYSGAYHALKFLLGDRLNDTKVSPVLSSLKVYNQSEFYPGDIVEAAMGTVGFIYIPKACQDGGQKCLLHFNFHGCNEYPPTVAREYILNSGFLPVAEAHNIVVVFPLTTKVSSNMDGCWDFYSYTGPDFATKNGKQIQVIYRILRRILHGEGTVRQPDLLVL